MKPRVIASIQIWTLPDQYPNTNGQHRP